MSLAAHPKPASLWDTYRFWESCRDHELRIQQCVDCGAYRFPPRPYCPSCRSHKSDWTQVSGRGTVYTWTVCYPPVLPAFAERVPYNAIVVQLDEGPFMVSNLLDWPGDTEIPVGLAVEVMFVDIDDGLTIPQFRAASPG